MSYLLYWKSPELNNKATRMTSNDLKVNNESTRVTHFLSVFPFDQCGYMVECSFTN